MREEEEEAERKSRQQADRNDPWDRRGRHFDTLDSEGDRTGEECWNAWRRTQREKEQQEEELRKRFKQQQQSQQQQHDHQQHQPRWEQQRQRQPPPHARPPPPAAATPMPVTAHAALAALQLPTTSTPSQLELQAAYRRAALRCHPDRPQNRGRQAAATAEFQRMKAARDLLAPNAR